MRRIQRFSSIVPLVSAALLISAVGAAASGLSADKLERLARIGEPALAPDGSHLVFTVSVSTGEARGADLWRLDLTTPDARPWPLTTHPADDRTAVFSGDGEWLYFLSTRSDRPQVYRLHVRGGDAEPVTDLSLPVHGFRLSKDGSALVVWLATNRACGVDFACTAESSGRATSAGATAGLARDVPQANDAPTRHGLFLFPLGDDGLLDGAPVAITAEFDTDVPARGADMSAVALSDDASVVAFVVGDDLVTFEPRTGRYRNLTGDDTGHVSSPLYLTGGDLIWLATDAAAMANGRHHIRYRSADGQTRSVAAAWQLAATQLVAAREAGRVFAIAIDAGRRRLFDIDLETDIVVPRTAFGWVDAVVDSSAGPIVAMDSLHRPADLFRVSAADNALYPLTQFNRSTLDETVFGVYEQWRFDGWNDEPVAGFLVRPPGLAGNDSVPLVVVLHDLGDGALTDHFEHVWHPQTFVAAGYAVLTIDYHGSDGYGAAFSRGADELALGKAISDVKRGIAAALERSPWLDGTRVCVLGRGTGATLVNTLAGDSPERFRCLVSDSGVLDIRMAALTRNQRQAPGARNGRAGKATPRTNPIQRIGLWQTPTLVLHDAAANLASREQSLAAHGALLDRGVATKLLLLADGRSPDAFHERYRAVIDWLRTHLDP